MYEDIDELKKSLDDCKNCKLCLARKNIVFGVGNKKTKIMFIGEGPGGDEDRLGEPFVGKAGRLIDEAFDVIGIKREDVYITNVVKCRPPNNRDPEEDEIKACMDYLRNQVMLIKPNIIVLLGRIALQNILGKDYKISLVRGNWIEKKGIIYMPTWHPAALLRDETKKIEFLWDLKKVKEKMDGYS